MPGKVTGHDEVAAGQLNHAVDRAGLAQRRENGAVVGSGRGVQPNDTETSNGIDQDPVSTHEHSARIIHGDGSITEAKTIGRVKRIDRTGGI